MVGTGWVCAQLKHNLGQVRAGQQLKKEWNSGTYLQYDVILDISAAKTWGNQGPH